MNKNKVGRKPDNSVKIRIAIDNKQNSSINFSIRLKDGIEKKEAIKIINDKLKEVL